MSETIRVLHLAESPYFGGINAHIRSVVEAFRGHASVAIRVATLPGVRADRWLFDVLGESQVYEVPMRSRFDRRAAARLRAFVAAERIDIVHTHNYRATLLAAHAKLAVPVVNTCHGMIAKPSLKLWLYQALELRAMRGIARTIAVSEFVRDWLVQRGVPGERVRIIHNGYDPGCNGATIERATIAIPEDAVVYLFVGRLVHGKGIREFIDAMRGIEEAFAVVVGDGPLRADSEAVAQAGHVCAHFAGVQRNVAPFFRLADVVVLPSRMEALPMALIEAAAHGKPVVASNVGGIPEVVVDDETGLLVPARAQARLREALLRLTDSNFRARLGAAAHVRWRERFTLARMADGLEGVYREALRR